MAKPKEFEGDFTVHGIEPRMSTKGNILRITLETTYDMKEHIRVIPLLSKMAHVVFLERIEQPSLIEEDADAEAEEFEEEDGEEDREEA